jgi:tRNA 2-selenouridine synthase
LSRIRKKLGDERYRELFADITEAERLWVNTNTLEPNLVWITKLLQWYYDPLYDRQAETRPHLFRGDYEACENWLMQSAARA